MLKVQHSVALTASVLVASLIGIQLGSSAIGAVNPIFFSEVPLHPRDRGAAVDPRDIEARRLARQAAAYDGFYDWSQGATALSLACAGCTIGGQAYVSHVPYFGSREEIAAADARASREINERYEARLQAEADRQARNDLVARYADYPVSEEDAHGVGGPVEEPVVEAPKVAAEPAVETGGEVVSN